MQCRMVEKRVKVAGARGMEEQPVTMRMVEREPLKQVFDQWCEEHPRECTAIGSAIIAGCVILTGLVEGSNWPN